MEYLLFAFKQLQISVQFILCEHFAIVWDLSREDHRSIILKGPKLPGLRRTVGTRKENGVCLPCILKTQQS